MLKDNVSTNARGILTIEAYNKEGTFFRKTKKNLVVETANEIMAQALADPNKRTKATLKEVAKVSTVPVAGKGYPLQLEHSIARRVKGEMNFSSTNVETTKVETQLKGLQKIDSLILKAPSEEFEDKELVEGVDFVILDEDLCSIEFTEAPKSPVVFEARVLNKRGYKIKKGSLKVSADSQPFHEAKDASDADAKFSVDYDIGEVYFETPKVNVTVEYDIDVPYGINFMALGGKPSEEWTTGKPVEFSESDKLKLNMTNEIEGTRVLLQFPEHISEGAPEIDLGITTKPQAKGVMTDTVTIVPDGEDGTQVKLKYPLVHTFDEGEGPTARLFESFISVTNITQQSKDIKDKVKITKNTITGIEIEFDAGAVALNDIIEVKYNLLLSKEHLTYKLGQAPVLKLLAVRHINSLDSNDIREYKIEKNGLVRGSGDVWISNSNTGHITFSENPVGVDPSKPAPKVHTPGSLQVEYLVNSGSAVKFTADFPVGMPEMSIVEAKLVETLAPGVASVVLPADRHVKDDGNLDLLEITGDGVVLQPQDYVVNTDNRTINLVNSTSGSEVVVRYNKEVTTYDVYQVAMFDEQVGGKMFNISGLGPIPKDKDTGIRVTWTVVF